MSHDEAGTKIICLEAELYSGFASVAVQHEIIFGARDDVQGDFVVLKLVFCDRQVGNLKRGLGALLYGTCLRVNCHILVHLALPNEVEVELTVVSQCYNLCLFLIYEEITVFKLVGL